MRRRTKAIGMASVVLVTAGIVGACSSNSSSSTASGPVTGTETFSGTQILTQAQAASNNFVPTIPLTAAGSFSDTGSIYLAPGSGSNGSGPGPATIKLTKGNIDVQHASNGGGIRPALVPGTCTYAGTEVVKYTVLSGTGSYKDVTGGHGTATVSVKLTFAPATGAAATGATSCANPNTSAPLGGSVTFKAVGLVTRSS